MTSSSKGDLKHSFTWCSNIVSYDDQSCVYHGLIYTSVVSIVLSNTRMFVETIISSRVSTIWIWTLRLQWTTLPLYSKYSKPKKYFSKSLTPLSFTSHPMSTKSTKRKWELILHFHSAQKTFPDNNLYDNSIRHILQFLDLLTALSNYLVNFKLIFFDGTILDPFPL